MQSNSYLFELNHPCHAHLFKHVIKSLLEHGHEVDVLLKESALVQAILKAESIPFILQGRKGDGLLSKALKQISFTRQIISLHKKNKYTLAIGVSVSIPLASKFSSIKSLVLDDDDKKATPLFAFLAHNNASLLLRPSSLFHEAAAKNKVFYQGYHELSYLHPDIFKPDIGILSEQGLSAREPFFILRLVALKAHHDIGIKGISHKQLLRIINLLSKHGRVIITSESPGGLPKGAEALKIKPEKIHHLMAYAKMIVSDGQTMCSEAACLGVPSIRINDFVGRISYLEELEKKWKLTFGFKPNEFSQAIAKMSSVVAGPSDLYKERRDEMVASSINVRDFLLWTIENYPESKRLMKENPVETQKRFSASNRGLSFTVNLRTFY